MQMNADNFSRGRLFPAGRLGRVRACGILLFSCLLAWGAEQVRAQVSSRAPAAAPSTSATAAAPSWPIFRGNPALTGVAGDNLPEKPGLLWTFKTGGPVKSSAVIGAGKVFIGSDDGNLYAVNFSD